MSASATAVMCGVGIGTGLALLWLAMWEGPPKRKHTFGFVQDLEDQLKAAGFHRLKPAHVFVAAVLAAVLTMFTVCVVTNALPIAVCFGIFAAAAPFAALKAKARKTAFSRRDLWPQAVDHLSSGVRAGLSLPEAVAALAERGPEGLRPIFAVFAREYRATGVFSVALDRLKDAAADPVADRIVAALRVTRDVGGSDLGTLLKTLSHFLREDSRTRAELTARQSWTVTGARLAVAAPWVVLAMLATRPEAAAAYSSPRGAVLLAVGLVVSLTAYSAMKRIGRLPEEPRVLRS